MLFRFAIIGFALLLGFAPGGALALMVDTPAGQVALKNFLSRLGTPVYQKLDPGYTETSDATVSIDVQGTPLALRYFNAETVPRDASLSTIRLVDPATGSFFYFDGGSRSASEALVAAFLVENYVDDVAQVLKESVAKTPNDPVAGTPSSLQAQMIASTFAAGSDVGSSPLTGGNVQSGTLARPHLGLSLRSGRYWGDGYSARVTSLPLSYVIALDDPRWALKLDAPLQMVELNGATSYTGSVGVGLRMPVYDTWTLTPEVRVGHTRNKALGLAGSLASLSITSNVRGKFGKLDVTTGNSVSYIKSFPVRYRGVKLDYNLENVVFRNGVELSGPLRKKLFGLPMTWQASVVNSYFTGSDTYVKSATDISFSLGSVASKNGVTWDSVRLGLTYTQTNNGIRGLGVNFGYEF
jgi:hypothetical protein